MANEGLGRERQGEKTNRESKGSQQGFSYISFAYCCSLNTAPTPALGFWPTVRCPVRKGVPSSKKALGVTTSGEPGNQVIQCEEQTSKNSSSVYQPFAVFRTEHAAGSAVCQLRSSLLDCMMRLCKAGASHPHRPVGDLKPQANSIWPQCVHQSIHNCNCVSVFVWACTWKFSMYDDGSLASSIFSS